ncbi:MAG: 16S rRNA (guanine(966)-N(2))-methyltransferase RsmD [Actinomycetales bacterium]|nr:16S rRNA (guanine(966)-N(2))-methyltransferase RsmD [Actinomycetales bacterium]
MTRIIAGLAGSIHLTPPAKSTRPTADRIRESIFNRLENWEAIPGARVLDLYAGTGALGLEALSRGAASVVLVDSNKSAAGVCRANVDLVGKSLLKQGAEFDAIVIPQDAKAYAHHAGESAGGFESAEFDLVFIDPPYDVTNHEIETILQYLKPALHEEFTVLVERSSRTDEPTWPEGYRMESRKDYGDTSVFWLVEPE